MSQHYSAFMLWTSRLMIMFMMNLGIPSTSFASIVETDMLMSQVSADQGRIKIMSLIQREDLRSQLLSRGVTVSQAEMRVKAMTDNEVLHISAELDRLPAGGDVLSSLLFVGAFIFLIKLVSGDFDDPDSGDQYSNSNVSSQNVSPYLKPRYSTDPSTGKTWIDYKVDSKVTAHINTDYLHFGPGEIAAVIRYDYESPIRENDIELDMAIYTRLYDCTDEKVSYKAYSWYLNGKVVFDKRRPFDKARAALRLVQPGEEELVLKIVCGEKEIE